jgi:hypothetical protein
MDLGDPPHHRQEGGALVSFFNPTLDKSHGVNVNQGFEFSRMKVAYDFSKAIAGGLEYYGALGPIGNFDPIGNNSSRSFPIDLNVSPDWEITPASDGTDRLHRPSDYQRDHWGRFSWKKKAP